MKICNWLFLILIELILTELGTFDFSHFEWFDQTVEF